MPADFVVPGQDRMSALLDQARTVVRRAERLFISAQDGRGRWSRPGRPMVGQTEPPSDLMWTGSGGKWAST